ncbi:LppU/SCO3897 family protein [Micromonospora echinospora]|uniref:LppU/SCO3897 family protein n=1 Tax=Micromonospora echinospora TaxID=1877 RepID=UPI003A8BF602
MTEQAVPTAPTEDESAGGEPADARSDATPAASTTSAGDATPAASTTPAGDATPAGGVTAPGDATPAGAGSDPADGGPEPTGDDAEPGGGGWHPLLRVLVTLGVVAVLVGGLVVAGLRYDVAGRLLDPDRTAEARVGDCLGPLPDVAENGQRRAAEARAVACSATDAAYDVVGRVDGQTEEKVRDGRQCEPFVAEGGTYYTYSSIPPGGTGYLLCLVPRS